MRKIKFRVWAKIERNLDYCILDLNDSVSFQRGLPDIFEQFIGLHDCQGKEIYEGDIVKFEVENNKLWGGPRVGEIKFNNKRSAFEIKLPIAFLTIGHGYDAYPATLQIIGNIHENPELLKG